MSYLRKIEWDVIPCGNPKVIRNCPKCGKKSDFINTEKFRVNANKSLIDIWLIYQCKKCKSTWNLALHERIHPKDISPSQYEKFLANDKELADVYGFDQSIHIKNKAEVVFSDLEYHIITRELAELAEHENVQEIKILCKYPIKLRVDKLLSEQLNVSRNQVKNLYQKGLIYNLNDRDLLHNKVEDNMVIYLKL